MHFLILTKFIHLESFNWFTFFTQIIVLFKSEIHIRWTPQNLLNL